MTAPIAIIMGSQSDWETMRHAAETLAALGVACDKRIVSAHRTPDRLFAFAKGAKAEGFQDHHRRGRRCRASAGHGGGADGTSGVRRSRRIQGAVRRRFAVLDRADARRHPGRDAGDRQGRRHQRRAARGQRAGAERSGAGDAACRVAQDSKPMLSPSARRERRDSFRSGEAEAGRHHRNSRRRTIGPDAGAWQRRGSA